VYFVATLIAYSSAAIVESEEVASGPMFRRYIYDSGR
jgi:hypothetical protein